MREQAAKDVALVVWQHLQARIESLPNSKARATTWDHIALALCDFPTPDSDYGRYLAAYKAVSDVY